MKATKTLACATLLCGVAAVLSTGTALAEPLQRGKASWYGPGFQGRLTANGERFNTNDLTAAHKTLPFGTKVQVTNMRTGQTVVVRINDRGPYAHGRIIDLSKASARAIGISGLGEVTLARLEGDGRREKAVVTKEARVTEQATVVKEARVAEELAVRTDMDQRTETVSDTVLKTEVDGEDERGSRSSGTGTTDYTP